MQAIARKLRRAWTVYRDLGPATAAARLTGKLKRLFGSDDPAHAAWLAQKARADAQFDQAHGVQTGGVQEIFSYTIAGANAQHGLSHIASDPEHFTRLVGTLEADLSQFSFVDLGAGKGRALILAAQLPFRRIIGVEFAAELAAAAKANIERLAATSPAARSIEVICGDATEYRFPDGPLLVYLFNPFGSAVIRPVAEKLMASWQQTPRPVVVIYMNAVHINDFIQAGWMLRTDAGIGAILVPPER